MTTINNAVTAAEAFTACATAQAIAVDNAGLRAGLAVLTALFAAGGSNKKSSTALWALVSEDVAKTFSQIKRASGALNAPSEKQTDGAKQIRELIVRSCETPNPLSDGTQSTLIGKVLDLGIKSQRGLLDFVAPRKESEEKASLSTLGKCLKSLADAEGVDAAECRAIIARLIELGELGNIAQVVDDARAFMAGRAAEAAAAAAAAAAKAEAAAAKAEAAAPAAAAKEEAAAKRKARAAAAAAAKAEAAAAAKAEAEAAAEAKSAARGDNRL